MFSRPCFVIILMLMTAKSQAQPGYVRGLVITNSSDTVICMVPHESNFGNRIPVKYPDGKSGSFRLEDIRYLATAKEVYENLRFYKANGKSTMQLMRIEVEGRINLYMMLNVDSHLAYGDLRSTASHGSFLFYYAIKKNDSAYRINEVEFESQMKPLLADAPELIEQMKKQDYNYNNLRELVLAYNKRFENEEVTK